MFDRHTACQGERSAASGNAWQVYVSVWLDRNIQHLPARIRRPPQPMLHAVDRNDGFVRMPFICSSGAITPGASAAPHRKTPDAPKGGSKLAVPLKPLAICIPTADRYSFSHQPVSHEIRKRAYSNSVRPIGPVEKSDSRQLLGRLPWRDC